MVTSGAIARGMRLMELPVRPRAMDELQAASAVGQGDLFRAYESRLAAHGTRAAQVLLTAADIAARTNYLNARQTLRRLIEWGVVPVVNENDTTATDEISFGDNDFLAAQVALLLDARLLVLLTNVDGLLSRRSARCDPEAELIAEVDRLRRARRAGDRRPHLGLRLRRDAQQGRRGGDGERGRDPGGDLQRDQRRARCWPPPRGEAGRHPLRAPAPARRRASSSGSSTRSRRAAGSSSTTAPPGCCARAAPACCRSGSPRSRAASRPATRSTSPPTARRSARASADYSSRELPRVIGMKSAAGARAAAARRRRGHPPRPLRPALSLSVPAYGRNRRLRQLPLCRWL